MFKLESVGYNLADFRIPDERGWVASNETILEAKQDSFTTSLPLEEMLETLQKLNPAAEISTDPGRYICNYVYFKSLSWAEDQAANGQPKVRSSCGGAGFSVVVVGLTCALCGGSTWRCSCTCPTSR